MSTAQPRIFRNQWGSLVPATLGQWSPTLSVSVVIPAHRAERTLPSTLAALAQQSYPSHLLEVVVVDDGSSPALTLPEIRPECTRLLSAGDGWGPGHARRIGAASSDGDVIHWLDADMVTQRDEVEAQMRWHHLLDHAVVLGTKTFIDPDEGLPDLPTLVDAVREDRLDALFADRWTSTHDWVEEVLNRTEGLRTSRFRGYRAHTGATASVSRDLLLAAGNMDPAMKLGEDIELGYRLQMRGGVFIPDNDARNWHLGRTSVMRREDATNRHNNVYFANRLPDLRINRRNLGRSYTVPYVEVIVDAADPAYERVRFTVDGILAALPQDLRVLLVGDWNALDEGRRDLLADPMLETRLLHEEYADEPRVRLVTEIPSSSFPATYRAVVPVGWAPGRDTLLSLVDEMQRRGLGLLRALLPDGSAARLESVAASERMRRLLRAGEDPDDVIDEIAGSWWVEGVEEGFSHASEPARDAPTRRRAPEGSEQRPVAPTSTADAVPTSRRLASRLRRALRRS